MVGYIDVGGGMRGVYGAGVLDRFLDDEISFSHYIGVSAGSANIVSHLAGHRDRTLRFYRDYSYHSDYMGIKSLLKNKSYLNLDYIYSTLTNEDGLDPLNFDEFVKTKAEFLIVTTYGDTGKPFYFNKNHIERNNCYAIKASCCVPLFCNPIIKSGITYFDGGIADPIPVEKAFEMGCERAVVTLTLPKDYKKTHKFPKWLYPLVLRKNPKLADAMYEMIDRYNKGVEYLKTLEKQGEVLILSPDDCCGITTLKRTKDGIQSLYEKGYNDAGKVKDFLGLQENFSEE